VPSALVHDADDVVAQLLIDEGYGDDGADGSSAVWPVFVGSNPADPDRVIVVSQTSPVLGVRDVYGEEDVAHGVQVYVRGPNKAVAGRKAGELIDFFAREAAGKRVTVTEGGDGYDYCVHEATRASGPMGIGKELGSRRNELSLNYLVRMTPLY
jgi:hypothetical protein